MQSMQMIACQGLCLLALVARHVAVPIKGCSAPVLDGSCRVIALQLGQDSIACSPRQSLQSYQRGFTNVVLHRRINNALKTTIKARPPLSQQGMAGRNLGAATYILRRKLISDCVGQCFACGLSLLRVATCYPVLWAGHKRKTCGSTRSDHRAFH